MAAIVFCIGVALLVCIPIPFSQNLISIVKSGSVFFILFIASFFSLFVIALSFMLVRPSGGELGASSVERRGGNMHRIVSAFPPDLVVYQHPPSERAGVFQCQDRLCGCVRVVDAD